MQNQAKQMLSHVSAPSLLHKQVSNCAVSAVCVCGGGNGGGFAGGVGPNFNRVLY